MTDEDATEDTPIEDEEDEEDQEQVKPAKCAGQIKGGEGASQMKRGDY